MLNYQAISFTHYCMIITKIITILKVWVEHKAKPQKVKIFNVGTENNSLMWFSGFNNENDMSMHAK